MIKMYLVTMDQLAREDIAAAAAAHHDLGRDYDGAVAEGLIERIGAEIDKRVDARLEQSDDRLAQRPSRGRLSPATRHSWAGIVLGLGSVGIGGIVSTAVLNASQSVTADGATSNTVGGAQAAILVLIWIIIGVINVAYARRR
jgi:hypothetical protein